MTRLSGAAQAILGFATLGSMVIGVYIWNMSEGTCPVSKEVDSQLQLAADLLNGVLELNLTIATALVGLGAAVLVGLQWNIRLTSFVFVLILLSIFALSQAILYAFLWKIAVANLLFNECLAGLDSDAVQTRYMAHFYAMIVGIGLLAAVVVRISIERLNGSGGGDSEKG